MQFADLQSDEISFVSFLVFDRPGGQVSKQNDTGTLDKVRMVKNKVLAKLLF